MTTEYQHIPGGILAAAIPVLIYTIFCLLSGILLVSVLVIGKERFSYVSLLAISTAATSFVSLLQQCHNMHNWHKMCVDQYLASLAAHEVPALALGSLAFGVADRLYWVQSYLLNVDGLLMLFWAIALVTNVWNLRSAHLQPYMDKVCIVSKVCAFAIPVILSGLRTKFHVNSGLAGTLIVGNIILLLCCTLGAICILLILFKYLHVRLACRSYAGGSSSTAALDHQKSAWSRLKQQIDSWLVLRFTIAWVIIFGFEVVLIYYCIYRYRKVTRSAALTAPDCSVHTLRGDIYTYIPAPTATFLVFLTFGMTKQIRTQYRSIFGRLCCLSRKSPQPEAQDWTRIASHDANDSQRHNVRNDDLETIEMNKTDELDDSTQVVIRQDSPVIMDGDDQKSFPSQRPSSLFGEV